MKVALLTDCYLPRLGGIEVQSHDLAAALQAVGHEVEVFTATPGSGGERRGLVEEVDGVRVHRMALRLPWDLPVNPLAPREVASRLTAGRFDAAHVQMGVVSPFATDLARVALGAGLPTAITWHCVMERSQPLFRVLGHARRWGARGAALSAVSGVAAAAVEQVAGVPVAVLPDGIDVARWARPADHPEREPDGTVRVVSAMRLAARKRPLPLLEAVAAARRRLPPGRDLTLEILGEGPDRARIERRAAGLGLEDVLRLPGRVSREELRQRYWSSDVYVAPARLEAFGLAALEARAAGLPVLALDGNGVGDFVTDGVNGVLATGDAGLADGLARLVADDALRCEMAATNRATAPAQDWSNVVTATLAEYDRAAGR